MKNVPEVQYLCVECRTSSEDPLLVHRGSDCGGEVVLLHGYRALSVISEKLTDLEEAREQRRELQRRLDALHAQWKDLERIQDRQLTLEALELELAEARARIHELGGES